MEYREILPGKKIPVLGIGTWGMGGRDKLDDTRDEKEIDAIRLAVNLGMKHIDTAEFYGEGHSEEIVGEAITEFDRQELFLTTKVWKTNLRAKDLINSIQGSLERLKTDYVDLYLVHWPNQSIPLKETMKALEKCIAEGWTRFIGVSNFSVKLMEEAQRYLEKERLVANQVHYSLLHQEPRKTLLPYLQRENSLLVAYRPMARGALAKQVNNVLDELCRIYKKTRIQVALNWLISQENVIVIPKSSNLAHLREIAGSVDWRLEGNEVKMLSDAF